MRRFLKAAAFAACLFGAGAAMAAPALVTTDLNIRTGPGTGYQAVGVLPNGVVVDVMGCTAGYSWCRVNYGGYDGWASSRYLAQQTGGYAGNSYSSVGASIGIPLIAGVVIGSVLSDDRDYYRPGRRYYRDRDWRRDARREWREERREDRRDWRADRRDDRRAIERDWRVDRRIDRRRILRDRGLDPRRPGETVFSSGR